MSELIYLDGGRVALKSHADPAVERVLGHDRFFLGLDLGRNDPTAIVLLHDVQLPEWGRGSQQILGERTRTVVYADRIRQTAYLDIAAHVAALIENPELKGRTQLCIDASSMGAPFSEVLTQNHIEHLAMTITAGASWRRDGHRVTVAKNLLIECMAGGFERSDIAIAHDLPLKDQLVQEIASFELATTAAGNLVLAGGGKGHHADMAIALALAFFASQNLLPGFTGVGQLENWY